MLYFSFCYCAAKPPLGAGSLANWQVKQPRPAKRGASIVYLTMANLGPIGWGIQGRTRKDMLLSAQHRCNAALLKSPKQQKCLSALKRTPALAFEFAFTFAFTSAFTPTQARSTC